MNKLKASQEVIIGKHSIGYVYSDFLENVGDVEFEPVSSVPTFRKLGRDMVDHEIESELKPGYCTLGDVIAFMDNAPGECKDGWANLFYLPQCVVVVYWSAGGREWGVGAWRRGGNGWDADVRVFSPATGSQTVVPLTSDSLPLELDINGFTYRRV